MLCHTPSRSQAAAISTGLADCQDRGHQLPQRADEIVLAHQHGAAAGLQNVDGLAGSRPVGRGMATTCPMRSSQRPGSVRLQVSSARRRMLPSGAIPVITTLTQTSVPPPARSAAPHPFTAARVPQDGRPLRAVVPAHLRRREHRAQPVPDQSRRIVIKLTLWAGPVNPLGRPDRLAARVPLAPGHAGVVRFMFWRRNARSGSDGWMYRKIPDLSSRR